MRFVFRSVPVLALVLVLGTLRLEAQQEAPRNDNFRWWIGANGGVTVFSTQLRERRGIPMAGGNLLIKAKRTGLLVGFEESFNVNGADTTAIALQGASGNTTYPVTYHDLRKIYAALMAFPFRSAAQPYLGVGGGIMQVVNPQVVGLAGIASPTTQDSVIALRDSTKSFGFLTFVAGINFNVGSFTAYGQYQLTSAPTSFQMLRGPTHTLSGGLRINLGRSRETLAGGGY